MSQNRYEVLGKIAEGGLGAVYKAYDRNLRREVALKRVRASSPEEADKQAEELFQEARTLSTLQHPHIVTIFDVGRDVEGAYIVMELLKGETLEDIIERGALNERDFRDLATQSLEGMISAHATGLIHLDIKPQNFMVIWLPSGKFQIKILDFGLSQISHQPLIQETDETGSIMGSIFFMAPEQFERSPVDVRTDLYSLGCVYYFALTQNYPFQGETAPEVMSSHLYHSFIPLAQLRPDLPKFISQWVEWLMHRDPNQRPANASEAFEVFVEGKFPVSSSSAPVPDYIPPPDLSGPERTPDILAPTASQILRPGAPRRPKPSATQALGSKRVPKPTAKPVKVAAAAAPQHLSDKKALPKWLTLWLPVTLAALVLGGFGVSFFIKSQRESRFDALSKMEQPVGTAKDLPILYHFMEDPAKSDTASKILGRLQNIDAYNNLIASHLNQVQSPQAVRGMASALAQRNIAEAAPGLLTKLGTTQDKAARIAIWNALASLAGAADVPALLNQLTNDDAEELRAAENAIVQTARKSDDAEQRSAPLLQTLRANTLKPDQQGTVLRALGKLGNQNALEEILTALKNTDPKIRTAAAIALGDWPTSTPIIALLDFAKGEQNPFIRGNAFDSVGKLAPLAGTMPQEEIATALIQSYEATKDNREQTYILEALAKVVSTSSKDFFGSLAGLTPRRRPLAESAVKNIAAAQAKALVVGTAEPAVLSAEKAELSPGALTVQDGSIINWFSSGDLVSWVFQLEQPGTYEIQLNSASNASQPGRYLLTFGTERFIKSVERTGGAVSFRASNIGQAKFDKPGYYRLWIRPLSIPKGEILMRVKDITITRVGE